MSIQNIGQTIAAQYKAVAASISDDSGYAHVGPVLIPASVAAGAIIGGGLAIGSGAAPMALQAAVTGAMIGGVAGFFGMG